MPSFRILLLCFISYTFVFFAPYYLFVYIVLFLLSAICVLTQHVNKQEFNLMEFNNEILEQKYELPCKIMSYYYINIIITTITVDGPYNMFRPQQVTIRFFSMT